MPISLIIRAVFGASLLAASFTPIKADPSLEALKLQYTRPNEIPFPSSNPYSSEKAALGKALFFDPRLSGNQNMNCASCHNPSFGWQVPLERAIGSHNTRLARSAPTLLNLAWGQSFFWDGRASSLEEQAKGPIEAEAEMNLKLSDVVKRLVMIEGYRDWFSLVFPKESITPNSILLAIATYERTIVSGYAPFDAWIDGDETAISDAAKKGFVTFNGKARCASCHHGWSFTDNRFHDLGFTTDDVGRSSVEPNNPKALFAFKTPGLRDIVQRAPYLHDGSSADLNAVIARYIAGGVTRPSLSSALQPVDLLGEDVVNIIAFLETLTAENQIVALPVLPH